MSGARARRHLVHPRWVWGGLGLILAGAVVLGVGIAFEQLVTSIVGAAVLLLGAAVSVRAGVMYDVHSTHPVSEEFHEVEEGTSQSGVAPGAMVASPEAIAQGHEADATRERVLIETHTAPRPPLARGAAIVLLLAAAFIVGGQGLYAHTHTGQLNAERDLGLAVVIALAGIRVLVAPGPHRIAGSLALVAGTALVLFAALTAHNFGHIVVIEAVLGVLVVLAAAAVLTSRETERRERPHPERYREPQLAHGRAGLVRHYEES